MWLQSSLGLHEGGKALEVPFPDDERNCEETFSQGCCCSKPEVFASPFPDSTTGFVTNISQKTVLFSSGERPMSDLLLSSYLAVGRHTWKRSINRLSESP